MTRTSAREVAVHIIYEYGFNINSISEILEERLSSGFFTSIGGELPVYSEELDDKQTDYIREIANGVALKQSEIDECIKQYAIDWNLNRISRIAMAIMRVAIFEIKYIEDVPESVSINEAIEIAKKYDSPETVSFINGILGSFSRGEQKK